MVKKTIKIITKPETDIYYRYHGLAINEVLSTDWHAWTSEQKIAVEGREFTYEKEYDFDFGKHTITYSNTGQIPKYSWYTEIYINNKLVASGLTGKYKQLKVTVRVFKKVLIPIGRLWRPIRTKTIQGLQTNTEPVRLIDKIKIKIQERM